MTINLGEVYFTITTEGEWQGIWGGHTANNYLVRITSDVTDGKGKSATFEYHTGAARSFDDCNEDDCAELIYCIVCDVQAGHMGLDEFQSEFGYDKASELINTYLGCQDNMRKWESICSVNTDKLLRQLNIKYNL